MPIWNWHGRAQHVFTFFKNPTNLKQKKYHRLQDSSCNTCSLLRGCAVHTHSPAAHVIAKQDHCSPPPTATHQASLSRCEFLPSTVLSSDGLNPYISPGLFGKVPAQLMHITTPPMKASSTIKACCYSCKFLNLPCNLRYYLKLKNFRCSQFKPRSQRCTVPYCVPETFSLCDFENSSRDQPK